MTKGARAMVILTVHVVGDGAADRDQGRARRHWRKPAVRQRQGDDLTEQDTGFALENAARGIEADESVEAACSQ